MSLDEVNGAAELLDDSSESQTPTSLSQPRGVRSLFFSGSQPPQEQEPTTPATEDPSPVSSDAGSASDDDWQSDPSESPEETGPPASSGEGPLKPLGRAALKATSRKGVLIATSAVHRVAARHELERAVGLYIADEQDQELIGDPIAELLHRRGGIVGGQMSADANDAISALMGLANYIGKQVALTVEVGQMKAAGVTVSQPHTVDGEVA